MIKTINLTNKKYILKLACFGVVIAALLNMPTETFAKMYYADCTSPIERGFHLNHWKCTAGNEGYPYGRKTGYWGKIRVPVRDLVGARCILPSGPGAVVAMTWQAELTGAKWRSEVHAESYGDRGQNMRSWRGIEWSTTIKYESNMQSIECTFGAGK